MAAISATASAIAAAARPIVRRLRGAARPSSAFLAVVMVAGLGGLPSDPARFTPPMWLFVLELLWSPVAAFAGGYVCVWISRRAPMRHAAALAGFCLVLSVVSLVAEAGLKPLWSSLGVIALCLMGILAGARFRIARIASA